MEDKRIERAIIEAQKKYSPSELVKIDCNIRRLATDHYKYGASMPLVYGKARGIQAILHSHYNVDVSIYYVWDVLSEMKKEQEWSDD